MPLPGHIANSGLYCASCNQPKPASELRRLLVKWKPTDREPEPTLKFKNRYCLTCLEKVKRELRTRGAVEFLEEPIRPVGEKEREY